MSFSPLNSFPIREDDLVQLGTNDTFEFTDARQKKRRLKIVEVNEHHVLAHCYETSYIAPGILLHCISRDLDPIEIADLPAIEQSLILRPNDHLVVYKNEMEGSPALINDDGSVLQKAKISCQLPEVFDYLNLGDKVLFDDGKIEGRITTLESDFFEVEIIRAKPAGSRLKAEKGMNFPDTNLGIRGLTSKDKADLEFVAKHADIVNFSFVNSREDIDELYAELDQLGVLSKLDIILKIETKYAFDNLVDILLAAMQQKYIGVMIARGDLAVETGWDQIGMVQEEILLLCGAAHTPVIWATQVLENLAKKGLPSRSEITDAATALKAECVMLNKGLYILQAIELLDTILSDMENHREKKESMLPKLTLQLAEQQF